MSPKMPRLAPDDSLGFNFDVSAICKPIDDSLGSKFDVSAIFTRGCVFKDWDCAFRICERRIRNESGEIYFCNQILKYYYYIIYMCDLLN